MNIGDHVSFNYANIVRVGKIIGKAHTRKQMIFVEFEYKPKQVKTIWIPQKNARISDLTNKEETE